MRDMTCQINPKYKECIKFTKKEDRYGNSIQYLVRKVTKGLYGTLLGAILYYNKLKGVLEGLGFKVNGYDKRTLTRW